MRSSRLLNTKPQDAYAIFIPIAYNKWRISISGKEGDFSGLPREAHRQLSPLLQSFSLKAW